MSFLARGLALAALVSTFACSRERQSSASTEPSVSLSAPVRSTAPLEPTTLIELESSAYTARLELDGDDVYLLTSDAAYRLAPGRPVERWPLPLGFTPALAGKKLVYWSDGALFFAPKRGGEPELVAKVPRQPQRLVTSGDQVAWLEQREDRTFAIFRLVGSEPRELASLSNDVSALAALDDRVYFVERVPESRYRLGSVPFDGGEVRYTAPQPGRTPAQLAAGREIFYYDGPTSTVRRVSPDLEHSTVIARDIICSPIAVAEKVYCAQPAGLLELPPEGGLARVLALRKVGPITTIAASPTRVAWLVDTGADRLAVQTLTRP